MRTFGRTAALTHSTPSTLVLCALVALTSMAAQSALSARPHARRTAKPAAAHPTPKPIDYEKITAEATDLLSKYIQINTTDPPGNELPAARMLREKFLAEGIPATIWQPQPNRAVIAARLHGIGRHTKAIVLLSHMDVVPADPKDWQVPPFSGEVRNGEIWGRGALDDKGPGIIELMAMLAIKRAGILLDRDVLFLATADEEEGGKNGAGWLVEHEPNVVADAGYLLNEGGEIHAGAGGRRIYAVSVSEKTPLWLKLTATGRSGHASTPPEQTAVTRLIRALSRLLEYRTPVRVLPIVQNYFGATAELEHGSRKLLDLKTALRDPAFAKQFMSVPWQNALVRDTIAPTVLSASEKTNVIPSSASAELDCRLLPGDSARTLVRAIHRAIADNNVRIDTILNFPAISSPEKSPLMSAIEKLAKENGKDEVVPTMIAGFTDSHYFRQLGIVAYGFIPVEISPDEERTVHGVNERMPVSELRHGIERMVELLKILGGR
jgi:acetylornithine deacetylase/succinyl-diaminopimelate desuccinylase-like protein